MKSDLWFQKWHKKFGEKVVESKVDKSKVDKGTQCFIWRNVFFGQKQPIEFQLFGLSTDCLKLSKSLMWFLKPGVSSWINFAPFCNILTKT